ncbi:hypothetical protein OF83DRAFT_1059902 [Amylostereum chailletii]|nr:hypothetical protein OF83DRAFT_1059902 [Amylostereum chailletii]
MAKNGALNPASIPFFPGSLRNSDEDAIGPSSLGYSTSFVGLTHHEHAGTPPVSVSPSERRSLKSSPSPQSDGVRFQQSPPTLEWMRQSPLARSIDSDRSHMPFDSRLLRQPSISSVDHLPNHDDHIAANPDGAMTPGSGAYTTTLRQGSSTPAIGIQNNPRNSLANNLVVTSSSPVSSLGSGSHFASSIDYPSSFEAQIRASPFINDLVDRLIRCEVVTHNIQRDLGEVNRKVDILVDRSLNVSHNNNSLPEFKDPFAPAGTNDTIPVPHLNGHRGSIANVIAPNQQTSDDITVISQRLNTLTSSVGQLLALQTQQHRQSVTHNGNGHLPSLGSATIDIPPNQLMPPGSMGGSLGHGLPNRPDLRPGRTPNPPMRTWSAGSLDLPVRPSDGGMSSLGRPDNMLRDKRRSVSNFMRRDSAGGDMMSGSPRDAAGPALAKWDQLPLAPELQGSLSKFGIGPPNKIQQRALPFLLRGADIIAQAPPTQERIAAYVIPAIHVALVNSTNKPPHHGPLVVMVSTTVDQATQAQRMIRDLGGPIGIRSALGVGRVDNNDLVQEIRLLQQNMPHIICGTPQKLHALFTSPGGLVGSQVRFLVLDEVDQLIARNLHEFIFNIVKLLPAPRTRPISAGGSTGHLSSSSQTSDTSLAPPFQPPGRRYSGINGSSPIPPDAVPNGSPAQIERQTALFSNTVPQDVLNLATAIQLREPVRVLVRRDGNVTHADTTQGARGLRQFYLYLAFTAGGGRTDASAPSGQGLGIIGSGRGASSAETVQAREWKLDALSDLFDDVEVPQAIVHVGGMTALDSVSYKLASHGLEAIPLNGDMNAGTKLAAINKFRNAPNGLLGRMATKVLVVYDVQVKTPDVPHVPLVVNYDLPKAVEEYSHRVNPAVAPNQNSRAGVVVNFVTATGGDVEMLRSIECFYKYVNTPSPVLHLDSPSSLNLGSNAYVFLHSHRVTLLTLLHSLKSP